ncbi:MAG TPA: cytochrome ubiquinol oxidase subunit I [Candidatus Dormibacteraeota bacterium]|nr:cytochrome ubiquinol oxidase subunit I [Candidatus Dormibacteraeota bacterium]
MLLSAFPVPQPRLPFGTLGAEIAIGATFLIHIVVVGFILGAAGITPFMELAGRRRGGDERCLRYARSLSHSILYLYSFGATWAVFAVVLLTGLYGRLIGTLLNLLLLPLTIAFASFFVGVPLLLVYVYRWDKMPPRLHLAVGFAFAAIQFLFLFMIVQLDSYALTPGTAVSAAHAMFSPSYPWLLLHYAGGTLSWSALFLAAVAVWRGRRAKSDAEVVFQRWAARVNFAIGSIFLLAQPITGFLLAGTIKTSAPGVFDNLFIFGSGSMFIGQVVLLAVVVLGSNLVFWLHNQENPEGGLAATLTVVALLGMAGTALPASIIPPQVVLLRYVALLIAFLATAANLVLYIRSLRGSGLTTPRLTPAAGRAIVMVGLAAAVLSIYMGVIKENSKLPCGIDQTTGQSACLLSLHQSTQNFDAAPGVLP